MGAKEECEKTIGALNERLEKHDENRRAVQETLHEVCDGLRRQVDEMEERINKKLGEEFTKEDSRLQKALDELRKSMASEDGNDDGEGEEREKLLKAIKDAESELLVTQRYELVKCDSSDKGFLTLYELKVEKQTSSGCVNLEKPTIISAKKDGRGEVLLEIAGGASSNGVEGKIGYRALICKKNERDGNEYDLSCMENGENLFSFKPEALKLDSTYDVKVKAVYQGKESEWSDRFELRTSGFSDCVWKECHDVEKGGKYSVDAKNPRIATKTGGGGCTIIGNTPLPLNKVTSWSIKVLKSWGNGYSIYIGVAPSDIDQDENDNRYKCGWYFYCWNSELWSGPPRKYWDKEYGPRKGNGEYVCTGDSVGVVMDTKKGKLSFVLNGVNLGVAFEGIPLDKPLVPCVLLYYEGDSVELDTSGVKENVDPSIPVPFSINSKSDKWDSITLTWSGAWKRSSLYQVEMNGSIFSLSEKTSFVKKGLLPESEHTLRVRTVRGNRVSKWSEAVKIRTQVPSFSESSWKDCSNASSRERKYYLGMLSSKVATKSEYGTSCTIIANTPLPKNKVTSWYVKIVKTWNNGESIYVGVAPSGINVDENDNHKKCGWYLHCHDSLLWSGPPHNYQGREYGPRKEKSGEYVHTGDSVGVVMDMKNGDLSFILENRCLDVGYDGIPLDEPLVPCVTLSFEGDSVELDVKKLDQEVITF